MYGADGWTFHHLTDPFGRTGVMDGPWGATPMDGPWMTFPLWRHYEYTLDTTYLEETAYPLMKGAAQFVMDFLIEDKEGYLVTAPSSSPENAYYLPGTDKKSVLTYASTMDIEIITALFHNTIEATEILKTDQSFGDSLSSVLKQLPPLQIGKDSTLQEWIKDYREVHPGHRHISHLLALYPLYQINPEEPELYEAARRTIEKRLSHGGGHTGWSRAWIVNFYGRLHMPEEAHKHLLLLFKKSTLSNLFDTHPPFQIDGNFGGTAGIAGMLLQSQENQIRILPALPAEWDHGQVKGLKARGNFTVDIEWKNNKLEQLRIKSYGNLPCKIIYGKKEISFDAQKNTTYVFNENLELAGQK
jgi:alpha-L-fucosidase 2